MHSNSFNEQNTEREGQKQSVLFNLAIIIMGTVSCYTTAMGLQPMLGNKIFSIAVAAALSLIMIAIALQLPNAYRNNRQAGLILGYIFVASFSVLLNYNFIFGRFSSEKILYKELEEHKTALSQLFQKGQSIANAHYQLEVFSEKARARRTIANEEYQNTLNPGKGKIYRHKDQQARLAENKLKISEEHVGNVLNPIKEELDSVMQLSTIALANASPLTFQKIIPEVVGTHNNIGNRLSSQFANFKFEARNFTNRDIGQLSHSLGSVFSSAKNGGDPFAVIVALILAILIDFIILFAIIVLNQPAKRITRNNKTTFKGFLNNRKITEEPLVLERNF